jgi:recombination protein RecT
MEENKSLSVAEKMQLEKKNTFEVEVSKANEAFLQMYRPKYGEAEAQVIFAREKAFAAMSVQKNPKIFDCTPASIYTAVSNVAMTGLTLDPVKQLAHLVPRGNICTLVVDYKGIIELLYQDSGVMLSLGAVYDCDRNTDDFKEGVGGFCNAKRAMPRTEGAKIIYCYSVAQFPDGRTHCHIMDINEINKRKKVAQTDQVWNAWEESMAMKTVARSHYKFLPKSERLDKAMSAIDQEVGATIAKTNISEEIDDIPVNVPAERPEGTVTIEKKVNKLDKDAL